MTKGNKKKQMYNPKEVYINNMKIICQAFKNGELIPSIYTCDGENVNPPLEFDDIPEGAASLALIMDDPDAPGGTFDHWLLWNIDPMRKEIEKGVEPYEANYGKNGFGVAGYDGPCPPDGTHRYYFKLYALNKKLNLDPDTVSKAQLVEAIREVLVAEAMLMGKYRKI